MSSGAAVFADPVTQSGQTSAESQQASPKTGDRPTTTLLVVREKGNPADIKLVDARKPEPVQHVAPSPAVSKQIALMPVTEAKTEDAGDAHSEQPTKPRVAQKTEQKQVSEIEERPARKVEQKPAPKEEEKPAPKAAQKPAVKPSPEPKKQVVAPTPKSPAPKSALKKAQPAAKPKAAATPDPKKQGMLTRAVQAASGLVSRALSWVGTRYVWGGFSSAGVDCSGLTSLIYKTVGVKLPHNARQQFKLGTPVGRNSLSPGDLVFFNTTGSISHVGIYIGNNKFVHAANKRSGVRTDSLGSAYYHKRFAGARRYI